MAKRKQEETAPSVENEAPVSMLDVKIQSIRATLKTTKFRIEGEAPMCVTRWTEKAKRMMLEKQTGKVDKVARDPRNPEEEFKAYFYMVKGKPQTKGCVYGIPAIWLKSAISDAAGFTGREVYKTTVRAAVRVHAEPGALDTDSGHGLVSIIDHSEPRMWTGMVRNNGRNGVADIRFRPVFDKWAIEFSLTYDDTLISAEQVAGLVDRAGYSIGLGDWRPQSKTGKGGDLGTFRLVPLKKK